MKNKIFKMLIAAAVLLAPLATNSLALPYPVSVGDMVYIEHGLGTTPGGQFEVYDSTKSVELFKTFCLERNEPLSLTLPMIVDTIQPAAVKGGMNTQSGDLLENETKWLYWNFVKNTLDDKVAGFDYTKNVSIDALQMLIWEIEGEFPGTSINGWMGAETQAMFNSLHAAYNANEFVGDVQVMNLIYENGVAQSLLVASVPEPGTMMLLGLGMLGMAVYGKRRMNKEA